VGVALRPREPHDLPALLTLLQRVHEQDGYPVRAVAVSDWWLASADELGGWVATEGDRVLGHVALHPADGAALPLWQQATGREPDGLAVVSRLFTDRSVRGAGSALLSCAVQQAHDLGRRPVLEVDPDSSGRALYLRRGWREVGTVLEQWGHRRVQAVVMVGPEEPAAEQDPER
jgi:GNAT superfamily N-acetyltransferase